jgi:hypothetical protein
MPPNYLPFALGFMVQFQGGTSLTHQTCEFLFFNHAPTAVQYPYWNWVSRVSQYPLSNTVSSLICLRLMMHPVRTPTPSTISGFRLESVLLSLTWLSQCFSVAVL